MNAESICLILGAVLVVTGVVGGGIELRELKIPPIKVPTRVFAVLAGVLFVALGIGIHSSRNAEPAETARERSVDTDVTATPGPDMTARKTDEWLESQLKNAVWNASDSQARAMGQSDPALLRRGMAGDALQETTEAIQFATSQGLYYDPQLLGQEAWEFSVSPDRQSADVRLTETWITRVRSLKDGRCVFEFGDHAVPQTVSLEHTTAGWVAVRLMTIGGPGTQQKCTVP